MVLGSISCRTYSKIFRQSWCKNSRLAGKQHVDAFVMSSIFKYSLSYRVFLSSAFIKMMMVERRLRYKYFYFS